MKEINKVEFIRDEEYEMLKIKVNGKQVFFGNYWDFCVPDDIVDLLDELTHTEIKEIEERIEV